MSNKLLYETSPYLRQHADNPVNWYPWGEEAFARARAEDKPVFLSIGYSTCHWCHVMARESFEDEEVADLLNRYYVAVKVDREERPDIDNIYMRACQAFTGGGGWPTSIFMTPDRKPFYAGTYYPKHGKRGIVGLMELLDFIHRKWDTEREALLERADEIVAYLSQSESESSEPKADLPETAVSMFERSFDRENGGFGSAPKFPTPHNLLFLLSMYRHGGSRECLDMAGRTLMQMYRGGMFDHIGGGFSRYSTDERFLVPHFEKMLYDNALMILAYCSAHALTEDKARSKLFLHVAERTADYVLREMTSPDGGFWSAQDADSEGEEGKYYVFTPREIEDIVPSEISDKFCRHYGISREGNFEGKSIPNLLDSDPFDDRFETCLDALYRYRRDRHSLHLDDKVLTAWNGLMIAAMCALYHADGNERYLNAARSADRFIHERLSDDGGLYASFSSDRRGARAFLDDYASYCFAQLALHRATLEDSYLESAQMLCRGALNRFCDEKRGGFYFTNENGDGLFMRTKETYDGAIPSGNSLMAWNLMKLWQLTEDEFYRAQAERQLAFMSGEASTYPMGYAMFLCALMEYDEPSMKAVIVSDAATPDPRMISLFPWEASVTFRYPSDEHLLLHGQTTFYICRDYQCFPPVNDPSEIL